MTTHPFGEDTPLSSRLWGLPPPCKLAPALLAFRQDMYCFPQGIFGPFQQGLA